MPRNNNNNRRPKRKQRKGKNRPRKSRACPQNGVSQTLLRKTCSAHNPFCSDDSAPQISGYGSVSSVPMRVFDAHLVSASQESSTSNYYIARRYGIGPASGFVDLTMDNGVTDGIASVNDSTYTASATWASLMRNTQGALHIKYTGTALYATGMFSICILPDGNSMWSAYGTGNNYPSSYGYQAARIMRVSATDLLNSGLTVSLQPTGPESRIWENLGSTNPVSAWQSCQIIGVGLASDATISVEVRQSWELTPESGTQQATMGRLPPVLIDGEEEVSNRLSRGLNFVTGNVKHFGRIVSEKAADAIVAVASHRLGIQGAGSTGHFLGYGNEF